VLPGFTGVAVHDAWAPYDTYKKATHALCNAHAVRELVYVVDTAPTPVAALAGQAIDAMVAIKDLLDAARRNGIAANTEEIGTQQHLLRSALVLARTATKTRGTKLERKHHALFSRMLTRWDDYQRCVTNPAVPWDNDRASHCTFSSRSAGFEWGDRFVRGLGLIMARATDSLRRTRSGWCRARIGAGQTLVGGALAA